MVKVVFFTVLCPELTAVASQQPASDQLKMFGYLHCCPEYFIYGLWVIPAKVRDGVMIGLKAV